LEESFDYREQAENQEQDYDKVLRPKTLADFAGQPAVVDNLHIFVKAAKLRNEPLDHVLLHGPPGLGKTTLANIIANEMGVGFKVTSGPVLDKPGDLAGLLTNLSEGDVLFIDEIHRLSPVVEEYLYSAMEDYVIDILLDSGPNARFGINSRLEYYDAQTLTHIVERSSSLLNIPIDETAAYMIASRSRGTPRIANALLRRVRDFAQIKGTGTIDDTITEIALKALNVDENGLDEMDIRILKVIMDKFSGGPVGLSTIATAIGENAGTLEEVYEPFLIQEGFLMRTPRGRKVTEKTYKHLGRDMGYFQGGLF